MVVLLQSVVAQSDFPILWTMPEFHPLVKWNHQ